MAREIERAGLATATVTSLTDVALIDNQSFGDLRGGWVDIFREHLENFVTSMWDDGLMCGETAA